VIIASRNSTLQLLVHGATYDRNCRFNPVSTRDERTALTKKSKIGSETGLQGPAFMATLIAGLPQLPK